MEKEILYIWLNKIKGIGPVLAYKLIDYFGSIDFVYEATYDELIKVDGIGPKAANTVIESRSLEESKIICEKCKKLNIEVVTKESIKYPMQLRNNIKAPLVLYVRGNLKKFSSAVSIVGARRCTEYGKDITIELVTALSKYNIPIISGMAKGIDSYAHTVALHNNNYTIAVLGTGVDKCYPSEHLSLMNKIIEDGAVISQFEPGTSNVKSNFLKRNELIAMLSQKIVVTEASKDSGALYTAYYGLKNGKQVYAVPGNINNKFSEGTNKLISEGANIYLSTNIISGLGLDYKKEHNKYSEIENEVLNIISKKATSMDSIKLMLNLTDEKIEEVLFEMEANGEIKQSGGLFLKPLSSP